MFGRSATPLYPNCCGSGAEHASAYQVTCWPLFVNWPAVACSPAVQVSVCWLLRAGGQALFHGADSIEYDRPETLSVTMPEADATDDAGVGPWVALCAA